MSSVFREWQRRRLQAQPFPEAWRSFLQTDFPLYNRLNANDQQELERAIQVFLDEKTFEGCGGLELTDEIRVLIAAQACLLLLHRETDFYPNLSAILVYPFPYSAIEPVHDPAGVFGEHVSVRLGESWPTGTIVLAWSAVAKGALDFDDGHNVVLHEFAHQLDQEDGRADGVPLLAREEPLAIRQNRYDIWAQVLSAEYTQLRQAPDNHLLDSYGATEPAEFFAVATETFFERPQELSDEHPALYEELRRFYRQDPARW